MASQVNSAFPRICRYHFSNKNCKFGENCKYTHKNAVLIGGFCTHYFLTNNCYYTGCPLIHHELSGYKEIVEIEAEEKAQIKYLTESRRKIIEINTAYQTQLNKQGLIPSIVLINT